MKNNILFLSELIPTEIEEEVKLKSIHTMQDSSILLGWNIIKGIEDNLNDIKPLTIFNFLPIYSFPKFYKDPFIKTFKFKHTLNAKDINIGFCNVQYIKQIFNGSYKLKKYIKNWLSSRNQKKCYIISFSLKRIFLNSIAFAKKINPNVIGCTIIIDLPEFILIPKNRLGMNLYTKWNAKQIYKLIPHIDTFVLITDHIAKYLKINKPFVVLEGIASEIYYLENLKYKEDNKIIFYAGSLYKKFGLINLLDAFSSISNNKYKLILCGIGDCEDEINKRAVLDYRIEFLGQLNRNEVLSYMQKATVIVNPRQNIDAFTKYSFPSKNLEALSSGIPLIAYKLDGIPDEYDPYIFYVSDNSIEALTNKIIEICEMPSEKLIQFGKSARDFVLNNKTSKIQTQKILSLFNNK